MICARYVHKAVMFCALHYITLHNIAPLSSRLPLMRLLFEESSEWPRFVVIDHILASSDHFIDQSRAYREILTVSSLLQNPSPSDPHSLARSLPTLEASSSTGQLNTENHRYMDPFHPINDNVTLFPLHPSRSLPLCNSSRSLKPSCFQ